MTNNLNREKLTAWNAEIWKEIDKAVTEEMGRIRVMQKILPSILVPDATSIPADIVDFDAMIIHEGQTKPLIEISVEFALTQSQADSEATLKTAATLGRLSAKTLALVEDTLVLQGKYDNPPNVLKLANKESAQPGLLGLASDKIPVPLLDPAKPGAIYRENTFDAVVEGINKLVQRQQPGPYALILSTTTFADAYRTLPGTLMTTADRLLPLLAGGFHGTGAMPEHTGLLMSLGGQPTTIYIAKDATTQYTAQDSTGKHQFRVFERIQYVARDPDAFVLLNFSPPPLAVRAGAAPGG